jgi:hypothetical protein
LNISRLAACIWIIFFNLKGMNWAMLVTISHTVTSITAFSVTKKPKQKKSQKKAELSWGNTKHVWHLHPAEYTNLSLGPHS